MKLPAGLLGMLALVVCVELCAVRGNLMCKGNVGACWLDTGRHVARESRGRDLLCFGDSMVKFGVMPRVIGQKNGLSAYNLALHGGSAPTSYFLLRRALEAGARPRVVLADFGREILAEGPASRKRTYPWPDLLSVRETVELSCSARDADLFAWVLACRALPSLNGRYEVRAAVLANLKGESTDQSYIARVLARNWRANDGAQVIPKKPDFQDVPPPPPDAPMLPGRWECESVNAHYLARFLHLAASHGIRVVWLLPPVSPGTQARWDQSGDERRFERFIRAAQARYENLTVLDARRAGFGRDVFVDGVHLDRDGATALSVGVADALQEANGRWVALKPFQAQPTDRLVVDFDESRRGVRR